MCACSSRVAALESEGEVREQARVTLQEELTAAREALQSRLVPAEMARRPVDLLMR
jgi:hypothetical protein